MRSRPDEAEETLERLIDEARAAVTEGRDAVLGLRSSTVLTNDLARAVTIFGEGLAADETGALCPEFRLHVGREVQGTPSARPGRSLPNIGTVETCGPLLESRTPRHT